MRVLYPKPDVIKTEKEQLLFKIVFNQSENKHVFFSMYYDFARIIQSH